MEMETTVATADSITELKYKKLPGGGIQGPFYVSNVFFLFRFCLPPPPFFFCRIRFSSCVSCNSCSFKFAFLSLLVVGSLEWQLFLQMQQLLLLLRRR